MRRPTRVMSVQKKPKDWSVGCFVAGAVWVLGEQTFHIGTNIFFLLAVLVFSFVVDLAFTGHSSRKDVFLD